MAVPPKRLPSRCALWPAIGTSRWDMERRIEARVSELFAYASPLRRRRRCAWLLRSSRCGTKKRKGYRGVHRLVVNTPPPDRLAGSVAFLPPFGRRLLRRVQPSWPCEANGPLFSNPAVSFAGAAGVGDFLLEMGRVGGDRSEVESDPRAGPLPGAVSVKNRGTLHNRENRVLSPVEPRGAEAALMPGGARKGPRSRTGVRVSPRNPLAV